METILYKHYLSREHGHDSQLINRNILKQIIDAYLCPTPTGSSYDNTALIKIGRALHSRSFSRQLSFLLYFACHCAQTRKNTIFLSSKYLKNSFELMFQWHHQIQRVNVRHKKNLIRFR